MLKDPDITNITSSITTIDDIVLVSDGDTVTGIHTGPHGLPDNVNVEIIGISTTTHANLVTQSKNKCKSGKHRHSNDYGNKCCDWFDNKCVDK